MADKSGYQYCVTAAGRVNLIGEHVDYCGGKVMPCALSLKNTIYVRPNGTDSIRLEWTDLPDKISMKLDRLEEFRSHKHARYFAGCAYLWREAGHRLVGCDILSDCSVPFGSGLSSSAAIETSAIAAFATVAGEVFDPVEVALVARRAEHEWAGVHCGIMDQYAAANGRAGCAILLDCATLEREYIPVRLGIYCLVIADCKKPHNLVESKYNERRAETDEALSILKRKLEIGCLADVKRYQLEEYRTALPPLIYRRARHVVTECERVRKAAIAMRDGTMSELGRLLNESHASLAEDYEVTGRELDALVSAAQSHPACLGSRMTGAGFGGCTVSLVKRSLKEDFEEYVSACYERAVGYRPAFYPAEISNGITVKRLES